MWRRVRKSRKSGQKFDVFAPQIWGGAFVNRHHFRPTGQVWFRSHGWSFIYADEFTKKSAVKYNALAFGGHNQRARILPPKCGGRAHHCN